MWQISKSYIWITEKSEIFEHLPPEIRFEMFDTMIKPILAYSSDVWGINKNALHELDRLFLNYVHCVLCVKLTTSNVIVIGERGKFPPSLYCHINVLCFFHRLLKMQPGKTVKSVFDTLYNLYNQGFIIFHKYCCYIKRGGITTNLTLLNHGGYVTDVPKYHNAGIWSTD